MISLLRQHGFAQNEREQILRELESLHSLTLTTEMTYWVSKRGNSVHLRFHDHEQNLVFDLAKDGSRVIATAEEPNYRTEVEEHEGQIRGSLIGSLMGKVRSNWVASRFVDAYTLEHDLEKLAAGAKFWFSVEKRYDGPRFVGYGEVLETSLEIRGEEVRKEFFRLGENGGVFVNADDLVSNRPFFAPVGYLRISSLYQRHRRHPITKRVQAHLGIDFEAPQGSPIFAPKKGRVARLGRNRVAGYYVVLQHPSGVETAYNHLKWNPSRILRVGQQIKAGQKIGEIGCTGYCTKAHLHFAMKRNGHMVDPAPYLKAFPSGFEKALQKKVARRD